MLHRVLAEQAGEDRVADPLVVEVVAAQVRDARRPPALDQGEPAMLAGIVDGGRHQTADVGREALDAGEPDVVLDHLVHRPVDVAVLLGELLVGCLGRGGQRTDTVDRAVQRLVHEARAELGCQPGDAGRQAPAQRAADTHVTPASHSSVVPSSLPSVTRTHPVP